MAPPELNLLHNALMLAFVASLLPDLPLDMAADGTPIGSSSTSTIGEESNDERQIELKFSIQGKRCKSYPMCCRTFWGRVEARPGSSRVRKFAHVALMARGRGVEWRSVRIPPPQMLTSLPT
ncbi:hypothetical protein BHM03_00025231 [Ensete ventricosum]|uniref:Secreted protein n=1 Tax=Ensete ventricosum TaxID=4639 RepID=A0A445MH03_ENSVE|nr:hypothetical protein BHM03_00025231 [Ensete ventricosum]